MKRSHATMSGEVEHESNKRSKGSEVPTSALQWFEIDDLIGIFIRLIFPDRSALLNVASISKAFWRQLHSKAAWQAAGFSLYYSNSQINKEDFAALLQGKQYILDSSKIAADVSTNDIQKSTGAVHHLKSIMLTDATGVLDPATKKASNAISPRLLAFVDMNDHPNLQIASISILGDPSINEKSGINLDYSAVEEPKKATSRGRKKVTKEPDVPKNGGDMTFIHKLVNLIISSKHRDVKIEATWALWNQLASQSDDIASDVVNDNEDLIRGVIKVLELDEIPPFFSACGLNILSLIKRDWKMIELAIPTVLNAVLTGSDGHHLSTACKVLSGFLENAQIEKVSSLIETINIHKFVSLLSFDDLDVQVAALKLLDNICMLGNASKSADYDIVASPNFFQACTILAQSDKKVLRVKVYELLSNLAATPECVQLFVESELMPVLLKTKVQQSRGRGGYETGPIGVLINLFVNGDTSHRKKLIELDVLSLLTNIISQYSMIAPKVIFDIIQTLTMLFKFSKANEMWESVQSQFEKMNGVEYLEELQKHQHEEIYQAAVDALIEFVGETSESD